MRSQARKEDYPEELARAKKELIGNKRSPINCHDALAIMCGSTGYGLKD